VAVAVKNGRNKMILQLKDETQTYDVTTRDHVIDSRCKRVFDDLISRRNVTHMDSVDIENFLLTPGKLVSKRITRTLPELPEALAALIASEQFKNIEKLIVCAYRLCWNSLEDVDKIMNGILASIPAEAEILLGLITEEGTDEDRITVHLIGICSMKRQGTSSVPTGGSPRLRCALCGRTEDDVAEKSIAVYDQIKKALEIIKNEEEIDILRQRIKKLDRITFTHVSFSDEATQILKKYLSPEKKEKKDEKNEELICMHCKFLTDSIRFS
jgi:cell division GTPase FtsZ